MNPRRNAACTGKVRYPSQRHASKALNELLAKQRGDKKLGTYLCRYCSAWHLGHGKPAA